MTTFNGILSSGTFDHGAAELQRWTDERRKRQEREDRAIEWLSSKLAGLTFHSFESLEHAAVSCFEIHIGASASADERQILTNAARACWTGFAPRMTVVRLALTFDKIGHVESLTFHRAA